MRLAALRRLLRPAAPPPAPGAPANYGEWLPLLRQLRRGEPEEALLARAARGSLSGGAVELELFADELARTLDAMLADAFAAFRRGMEVYAARGDDTALLRQFRQLRRRLELCLFFEALDFLPEEKKRRLGAQVRDYALAYWRSAVAAVEQDARRRPAPQWEDALHQLRRMEPFAPPKEWELL